MGSVPIGALFDLFQYFQCAIWRLVEIRLENCSYRKYGHCWRPGVWGSNYFVTSGPRGDPASAICPI